jgi:hypothetical protein
MTESRFAGVRAQLVAVRRAAAAGAVVLFAVLAGLARESHPGATTPASSAGTDGGSNAPRTDPGDGFSTFGFDGGSVGPSTGGSAPVQSGGS